MCISNNLRLASRMVAQGASKQSKVLLAFDRNISTNLNAICREDLKNEYDTAKGAFSKKVFPRNVERFSVFSNDQVDLSEVDVYGFDYDYTLASYNKNVEYLIYDTAKEALVDKFCYPKGVKGLHYDPRFACRGLHFDIAKGLHMKVDNFHQIQPGTVYKGHKALSQKEVLAHYRKRHINLRYLEQQKNMVLLADIFSKPHMSLIADVIEYFCRHNLDYEPASLYNDVTKCIAMAHPVLHTNMRKNPQIYMHREQQLKEFLSRLCRGNKKIFLITNSPFETVNIGMSYMVGDNWRQFFDVVIVQAGKPNFFTNNAQPFRELHMQHKACDWHKVTELKKENIYVGGTVDDFQRLTGWQGGRVVYFGDHPYADLADISLLHGWKTAAVIRELEKEIDLLNMDEFKSKTSWKMILKDMIEENQDSDDSDVQAVLEDWKEEVETSSQQIKEMFNPRFGSMFRCHNNPSYFSRRLCRFADLYTSRVTNMLEYSQNHTFYPRRTVMPHELV